MDVIKELTSIVDKLNAIDDYNNTLMDELSKLDLQEQDLLHYIEFNKINVLWCYHMVREIKNVRQQRRKIKNDKELIARFNHIKNQLIFKNNRQALLDELKEKDVSLNQPYKNRQYTDEEMQKVLKGV